MKNKLNNIILAIKNHKILIAAVATFLLIVMTISFISYESKRKELIFDTYATIDDYNVSNLEYMYFYQNFKSDVISVNSSYFASLEIPEGELLEQQIKDEETGTTWADYFSNYSFQQLLETHFLYELAIKNNFIVDNLDELIEEEIHLLKDNAIDKNISFQKYLSETFIDGVKEKEIKEIIEKNIIATKYKEEYKNSLEVTEEEINQYYEDNKNEYDVVSYRIFSFSIYDKYLEIINKSSNSSTTNISSSNTETSDTDNSKDDEITIEEFIATPEYVQAKEDILKTANDFYNQVYDEETFKSLCINAASNDNLKNLYENYDYSLKSNFTYEEVPEVLKDWMFENNKEPKSTAIIYDENNMSYHVVYFIERHKIESSFVTIKNILIPFESSDLTTFLISEEDKTKAKDKMQQIVDEWELTDRKSETFTELAKKYSKDSSGKISYSNLTQEELPIIFAEWAYSKDRKSGDYEVFNDDSGYYLTYFDKTSEDILSSQIKNDLIDEKFYNMMKEMINTHSIKIEN